MTRNVSRVEQVLESLQSEDPVLSLVDFKGETSDGKRAEEDGELEPEFRMPRRFFSACYLVESSGTTLPLAM